MKIIQSNGGPLIGLHRSQMHLWSGADGKTFIGESSPSPTDYEAGGVLTDGRATSPRNIAKIVGERAVGLLISLPFETAIIDAQDNHVYLAQVHYAHEDWTFSSVTQKMFEQEDKMFDRHIPFSSDGDEFVLFDSAYTGNEIVSDCLVFNLNKGSYIFSSLNYYQNDETLLILYRIKKSNQYVAVTT